MRIGINIPNELLKRLEPLKPELNISQVCRDALEAKAKNHERMMARLDDPSVRLAAGRVWEREKELRAAVEVDWDGLAWEDAAAWVQAAGQEDWWDLHDDLDICKEREIPQWQIQIPYIDGVNGFWERTGELTERMSRMRQQEPGFDRWLHRVYGGLDWKVAEQEYMTAWVAYTKAAWERFVAKAEKEYQEERRRERTEAIRNRPQPEVPQLAPEPRHREE